MALRADGTVDVGQERYGQLGNGTTTESLVPIQVGGLSNVVAITAGQSHTMAVTATGQAIHGDNVNGQLGLGARRLPATTPQLVNSLSGMVFVSAGDHSLAVESDGTIWTWELMPTANSDRVRCRMS